MATSTASLPSPRSCIPTGTPDRYALIGSPSARPPCRVHSAPQRRRATDSSPQPPQVLLGRCAAGRAVELDRHPVEPSDGRGQTAARTGLPGDSFALHVSPGRHANPGEAVPPPTRGSSQAAPADRNRPTRTRGAGTPPPGAEMAGKDQKPAVCPQPAAEPCSAPSPLSVLATVSRSQPLDDVAGTTSMGCP